MEEPYELPPATHPSAWPGERSHVCTKWDIESVAKDVGMTTVDLAFDPATGLPSLCWAGFAINITSTMAMEAYR